MPGNISRRKLLRAGGQAIVAGSAAACVGSALPAPAASSSSQLKGVDYYEKLGVTPFINAAGTTQFFRRRPCRTKCRPLSHWLRVSRLI